MGTALERALQSDGHEVVVLARRADGDGQVFWDRERLGPWAREIDGSDVVIKLASCVSDLPATVVTRCRSNCECLA